MFSKMFQIAICSKFKVLTTSFLQVQCPRQLSSCSCPLCCLPATPGGSTSFITVTSFLGSSSLNISTVQPDKLGHPLPMQRSRPTLAYKYPILLSPTLYFFPLRPSYSFIFLDALPHVLPSLLPLTGSGFCNEVLGGL